jgi:beta-lactamase regulating signal transducer with metallopeptidase domain
MTFAAALTMSLLHFLWQGALGAIVLQGMLASMRGRSAHARYLVASAGLVVLALAPAVTTLWLWTEPTHALPSLGAVRGIPAGAMLTIPTRWAIGPWLLELWCVGVCLCSLRLFLGAAHAGILVRRGSRVSEPVLDTTRALALRMQVRRPVRVLISDVAETPSVVGWLRPVILLPVATLAGLSLYQVDAVIAHELAHIRRHDFAINLLQMLIEAALFYHPAVWWLSTRVRHERELCCDDIVVALQQDPLDYARALASLERFRLAAAVRLGAGGGHLTYRIKRLVGTGPDRPPLKHQPALLACAIAIVSGVVLLGGSHTSATTPRAGDPGQVPETRPQGEPDSAERRQQVVPIAGTVGDDNGEQSFLAVLAASELQPPPSDPTDWAVGRRLVTIQLLDVPDAERGAWHLPISIGGRLSSETVEQVAATVANVDPRLVVSVVPLGNDAAGILVSLSPVRAGS